MLIMFCSLIMFEIGSVDRSLFISSASHVQLRSATRATSLRGCDMLATIGLQLLVWAESTLSQGFYCQIRVSIAKSGFYSQDLEAQAVQIWLESI